MSKFVRHTPQHQIIGLTLENFQSFSDRAILPLSSITFLLGPNSSGKSSVLDALDYLDTLFSGSLKEFKRKTDLWRHQETNTDNELETSISITFRTTEGFNNELDLEQIAKLPAEIINHREQRLVGNLQDSLHDLTLEVVIGHPDLFDDAIKLLRLSTSDQPIFEYIFDKDDPEYCGNLKIFRKAIGAPLDKIYKRHGYNTPQDGSIYCGIELSPLKLIPEVRSERALAKDFLPIANFFLDLIRLGSFSPNQVGADRGTIPNKDLFSFFTASAFREHIKEPGWRFAPISIFSGISRKFTNTPADIISNLNPAPPPFIEKLLWSYFCEDTTHVFLNHAGKNPPEETIKNKITASHQSLHLQVNKHLSDNLFLDRGYQIVFEAIDLALNTYHEDPRGSETDAFQRNALVTCWLTDQNQRKLTFEEVGTGISCVLPVLVSLYGQGTSFVQQPELHLHPALQAALGDALIESRSDSVTHIWESHSEFILLRCLRRIRETSNGKTPINSTLSLKPEDISVLYFSPTPDGSTTVKKIRISRQGDFVDRWPSGFFGERGRELFDE